MVQVCIHIMSEGDKLSQGSRHVMREDFLNVAINGIGPVKLLIRKVPLGCVLPEGIHSCPIVKDKCLAASYCLKLKAGLETLNCETRDWLN